jgi:RNA polymerase sigma factor for flagellar operon FliA
MPRSVRMRSRQLQGARADLQHRLGRQPSHEELASALSIDLPTYWRWQEEIDGRVVLQLDAGHDGGDEHAPRLADSIADVLAADPGDHLDDVETVERLKDAFDRLGTRDRLVLSLYYYEELNLRQIGEVMHVSESRISQIRTRALKRLRELVEYVEDEAA